MLSARLQIIRLGIMLIEIFFSDQQSSEILHSLKAVEL